MSLMYNWEGYNCGWAPEPAFRQNAAGVKDGANAAGTTFYPMPVRWITRPEFGMQWDKKYEWMAGSGPDPGYLAQQAYTMPPLILTGPLHNFDLLKYIFGACTTTGPVSSNYTHTYATTTSRGNSPPSFMIWEKIINDGTGADMYYVHHGCSVRSVSISGDMSSGGGDVIMATFTIDYAITVAGIALNTEPSRLIDSQHDHHMDNCAITLTDGVSNTALATLQRGFSLLIDNGIKQDRAANEQNPERLCWGNRNIILGVDLTPQDWADFVDSQIDPNTTQNIVIDVCMTRNAVSDYTEFNMTKCWAINTQYGTHSFNGRYLRRKINWILNAYETGKLFTVTQVDQKTSARF